ncbi:nectin-4 isoform X1 [Rhinichthys klamathensis goyatoka]|uniref:nectin-4 isoform X1 n=1 Tax=Rhinichthys klamathensis goyatoka TaxID=3034132 RepID=UPI0024B4C578|nr:nectin-4 isoform X1 [Rhinichthys klamathensis goyatoka]XP_056115245.1 nectin-4 isoform X1 [Rhinichthys klamathensis goyatoka]
MKTVSYILAAMIFWNSAACVSGEQEPFLEPSKSPWDLQSLGEEETRLPCRFNVSDSETQVVQVTWIRQNSNGAEEQIITVHFSEGQTENPAYSGRVRFETNNPIADSALIIMRTSSADEGKYTCKVATFPSGNFETVISLTVWTKPITSLEEYVMVEGQSFRPAATCRSMAKPMAGLSWDTDLSGQSQNLSLDGMVASIQFSLHPLRSMNGRKLDCLVWHPSQNTPQRISSKLTVHYPPNALISGYEDSWHAEMQGATLQCNGEGNPKPHRFNWTRKGEALPEGVTVDGGTLSFSRPLLQTDQGDYICTTTNLVGSGKAEISITILELPLKETSVNYMMMIIIAGVAAAVVLTLIVIIISVNRHYKRKNKQLAIELNEKKEEISTLSRQASFRRVNSSSTDNRYSEENHPLRVEGTIRTSLSSLDRPRSRDSRSTLERSTVDSLGRPAIFNSSRRGQNKLIERSDRESTRMMMMESYDEDSNMSQETQLLPPLHPSSYSMDQAVEMVRSRNGSAILPAEGRPQSGGSSRGHHSPMVSTYPTLTDEEEEDSVSPADSGVHRGLMEHDAFENGSSETASSQISEALSNHFERTNGTLRPKSKPNNILLPAKTTLFLSPHSPTMHKAQIV